MEKPEGFDDTSTYSRKPMYRYLVYLNNIKMAETHAVSEKEAANNVRWKIYREYGDWRCVPPIEAFDCIRL